MIEWTTGEVTLSYPSLVTRDDYGKLTTQIIFNNKEDIDRLQKIIDSEADDLFPRGKPDKFISPLKDGNAKMMKKKSLDEKTGEVVTNEVQHPDYEGKTYCSLSTAGVIAVLDAEGDEIADLKTIKGRDLAKVSLEAKAYDYKGKKGVTLKLLAIQKLADGQAVDHTSAFKTVNKAVSKGTEANAAILGS